MVTLRAASSQPLLVQFQTSVTRHTHLCLSVSKEHTPAFRHPPVHHADSIIQTFHIWADARGCSGAGGGAYWRWRLHPCQMRHIWRGTEDEKLVKWIHVEEHGTTGNDCIAWLTVVFFFWQVGIWIMDGRDEFIAYWWSDSYNVWQDEWLAFGAWWFDVFEHNIFYVIWCFYPPWWGERWRLLLL